MSYERVDKTSGSIQTKFLYNFDIQFCFESFILGMLLIYVRIHTAPFL